jgi:hypothetical protein
MIDKSTTILIALVIISITSITITMIVSVYDVPKEIEPIEKQVDNSIIEPIEKQVDNSTTEPTQKQIDNALEPTVPTIPEVIEEVEIGLMINQSLKGFNTVKGEELIFNIKYSNMADVRCCEQNTFDAFFSFFNEETGEYVDLPLEGTFVTEGGLMAGTISSIETDFMIYSSEWIDNTTTVIVEVYDFDGNLKNILYFPSTPYYLITPEDIREIEKTVAGFTLDELIEIGKIILPLLI